VLLGRVSDVCAPYLGTVVAVVGDTRLDAARRLTRALHDTAREICRGGGAEQVALDEAGTVLGLDEPLARAYVERLRDPAEGLVLEEGVDHEALATIVGLRRRYLPRTVDGVDVLEHALAAESGLVAG
jgi:hypothetical protein